MHYLKEGHRLHNDKYQLLNVLGEGGFSLTYRGAWKTEVQGTLGKVPTLVPVCIKEYFFKDYCLRNSITNFIETNSETGKEIFDKNKEKIIKEARILSEIHHPNVVSVLEVFKQNNTVYIVMEFIAGHSLKQEVEQNGLFSEDKLKKIIFKIGQALDYIHEKNILHLDIKPSNILLDRNNNPKLIDFGISKRYDLSGDQETSTTLLAASKGYASVEQYDSEGMQVFSPRPDIYSLGATMYYLLTSQVPTESILRSTKGLQEPRELNPEISENIQKVILKAMALNASERYETIMEMLADLGFDPETDKIDLSSIADNEAEKMELIKSINAQPYDADLDDETIIHPNIEEKLDIKKSTHFWIYAIAILLIPVILFLFINNNNRENPENTHTPDDIIAFNNYFNSGISHFNKNNLSQAREDFIKADEITESAEAKAYIIRIDSLNNLLHTPNIVKPEEPPVINIEKPQTPEEPQPVVDTKTENYSKLFNNANIAYNQREYSKAFQMIQEALSYKETIEAKQLSALIKQEVEKIEIEKKKKSYDIRWKFGNFDVVKKLSDGKYGAIDSLGNEKIPCKYTYTEVVSGGNRLFQRDDNLYDLYAPSGVLIEKDINGQNF